MQASVSCDDMALLLQADTDGELDAAQAATVARHVAQCPQCAQLQERLLRLRQALQRDIERPRPSAEFVAALRARMPAYTRAPEQKASARWRPLGAFGAGAALAASLLLMLHPATEPGLEDIIVGEHVRSLQADHLLDVVSTDQHTVKPWFNGRLDFVPPVQDFAADGFPLAGGRLDYFAGRTVAALVYHRQRHPINVFIWPAPRARDDQARNCSTRSGYHLCSWSHEGMMFWAVSDLNAGELEQFTELWSRKPAA